jgi:5-methylcytosine-specific restriction protein B
VPVNQILYGPPGTGKTYNTINEALRILEPRLLADPGVEREALLEAFNRYKAAGQIVFCTFHQSFSYEDFVEGLRANTDNGQVRYSVEAGIFKQLCQEAAKISDQPTADELLNGFIEQVAENPLTLETSRGKRFAVSYKYGNATLTCMPEASEAGRELPANISHIRQYIQGIRPGNIYCESYVKGIADHIIAQLPRDVDSQKLSRLGLKPFVLIIDEINRGNISRIFGELITLIEPSKRAGEPEALSVQLPYSKEPFAVPSNVNLIGTMNTADRSLASLDIALRRRFTFKEMPPIYEDLDKIDVAGLNIALLLRKMNARIEVLLDRDHCLGHAYFLPLRKENTIDKLAFIFRQQILPLLQEYFFEDWERIAWVLNDQNKDAALQFIQKADSNLASLFDAETAGKLQDRRWLINETAFENIDSYKAVIGASE